MGGLETRACIANKIIPLHCRGSGGCASTVPGVSSPAGPDPSHPGEGAGQSLLLFWKHSTEIDEYATVLDAGNDWSGSLAEPCAQFVRAQTCAGEREKLRG